MSELDILSNGFFFNKEHFETFLNEKIYLNTSEILEERKNVQIRLLELHDLIYPKIKNVGWNIDKHYSPEHIVSGIDISSPFIENRIRSIWLHYGKTEGEIKRYKKFATKKSEESFINHIRLQVIVYNNARTQTQGFGVGSWLVVGKNNGSIWDRDFIQRRIKSDEQFLRDFHNLIANLDAEYLITVNDVTRKCDSFTELIDFKNFILSDKREAYFIIGKDFKFDDVRLKEIFISETIFQEFSRLYPLYQLLKHEL